MKRWTKNLLLLPTLITVLGLMLAGRVTAQTFTTLHSFTALNNNSDGANPVAGLIVSSNILYGTAEHGGSGGRGTVFAINTDGTGFATLYSFTGGSDGANPVAGLIVSSNTLYGTAQYGGSSVYGTVFAVNTNGTGFTNLHSFTVVSGSNATNSDGAFPQAGLLLSGNTLYGTANEGGGSGSGTVFAVNTNGTGFKTFYSFTAAPYGTNSDGAYPSFGLLLSGSTLYGTARNGGSGGRGTVFAINTNGTGFTNLYSFTAPDPTYGTNSDGAYPSGLLLSGNTLYGTAAGGGTGGQGTVFKVNTDGTAFSTLHSFTALDPTYYTNSDGGEPSSGLILSGSTLYGTAYGGGSGPGGTVFAINTNGTGFTNLYKFTAPDPTYGTNSDGAFPQAGLLLSGNTLYGTAYYGGSGGNGTVFSLSLPLPPQLAVVRVVGSVILTWPTNATGFTLQSTTNLVSPIWITNSSTPVVVNGQNTVTNPISARQQFFRLSQ